MHIENVHFFINFGFVWFLGGYWVLLVFRWILGLIDFWVDIGVGWFLGGCWVWLVFRWILGLIDF